ncbi:MAG: hypothetical protein WBM76_01145 [Woeseiaceae bacterium]
MFDLTYSRKNIVRTVATGFTLGALVLSTGSIVIIVGMAAFGVQPFALKRALLVVAMAPVVFLFYGIVLGWVVRLGLGLHAFWSYRRNPRKLTMPLPGEMRER